MTARALSAPYPKCEADQSALSKWRQLSRLKTKGGRRKETKTYFGMLLNTNRPSSSAGQNWCSNDSSLCLRQMGSDIATMRLMCA